jgi:hypothetical protein
MQIKKNSPHEIIDLFYSKKVLIKKELLQLAGCSNMTAWRVLSAHGYISSYNFNAKYYTLFDIPVFDKNGLWTYQNIYFSKCGTLTNTVIELINNSESGMNKNELQKIMKVNVATVLAKLYQNSKLYREKVNGLYIYFHRNKKEWSVQLCNRKSCTIKQVRILLPEPERIIAVLVELIPSLELQPQQVSRRLSRKGIKITIKEIKTIFQHYHLEKKTRSKS